MREGNRGGSGEKNKGMLRDVLLLPSKQAYADLLLCPSRIGVTGGRHVGEKAGYALFRTRSWLMCAARTSE